MYKTTRILITLFLFLNVFKIVKDKQTTHELSMSIFIS